MLKINFQGEPNLFKRRFKKIFKVNGIENVRFFGMKLGVSQIYFLKSLNWIFQCYEKQKWVLATKNRDIG